MIGTIPLQPSSRIGSRVMNNKSLHTHLKPGMKVEGFEITSVRDIPEYRSIGIRARHSVTGCDLYHLFSEDDENLFAFIFKTPSRDNSGVAHILEHSVLSGSKRFPIKDPFLALMKGSVNTFLNAMTYPDKTVYPASSILEKDYFNLMDVYGDAVFFPLLRREIFMQEGIRFERGKDGLPIPQGVVFNEMQGAYSNHDSIVAEWSYRTLFPDTPYRFDSGGEPESILELTYEDFVAYHRTYYHPSNCRIFLYGNIPTEKQMAFIEEKFLSSFDRLPIDADIPLQPRWSSPRVVEVTAPSGGEDDDDTTTITVNWLTFSLDDPVGVLSMEVLAEILLGNSGSPLEKAIVDSGLGDDVSPVSGLESEVREMVFSVGLRGSDPSKREAFEELVFSTLRDLASRGIPSEIIEGALRRVEFRNREIKGGYPFGLRLMGKALRGWLHGSAPEETLEFSRYMAQLKAILKEKPTYFEELIRTVFLDNNHRVCVVVRPDAEHEERQRVALRNKLSRIDAALGEEGRKKYETLLSSYEKFHEIEDSEDALKTVPSLSLSDIPKEIEIIETEETRIADVPLFEHDLYTNGVTYIDVAFDLSRVPERLSLYLPLFSRVLCNSGIPGLAYDELARKLSLYSGGVSAFLESSRVVDQGDTVAAYLFFRIKMLDQDIKKAMDLMRNILLFADFSDRKRVKDLILEGRNDFKSSIVPMGSSLAALRAAARLSPVSATEESWRGVNQFLFISALAQDIDERIGEVIDALEEIRRILLRRESVAFCVTTERGFFPEVEGSLSELAAALPSRGDSTKEKQTACIPPCKAESLIIASPVGFAATCLPGARLEEPRYSHQMILAQILKTDYLWAEVRMKGGAYGVSASADGIEAVFSFSSYRDPNVANALTAFREGLVLLSQSEHLPPDTVEKAIISVVGKDMHPLVPGEKGLVSFRRKLFHITDSLRREKRLENISTAPHDLTEAAGELLSSLDASCPDTACHVVMGSREMVEGASALYPGFKDHQVVLPM